MADYTKWRFANTLIDIMLHKSFKKITVKDICDHCNERRQTFYYHFRDKYDLVTWIYYQDASQIIDTYKDESWDVVLEKIFENMLKRRNFYRNVFEENCQNALIDYLVEHDILIYEKKLKDKMQIKDLDASLNFAIKYHAYACANITKNWLNSASSISPQELAKMMFLNMPTQLREVTLI
ncbi:MAG TPA: TetR/AcrR family transcriptional regulator C-terminal domain-containing protein [Anaerovoracaceae bacterium]|nr:TetR/AcrR family transcriptional regulator C-terminal domain-containing protein [Anaerovoracaceae bacterium]